MCVCVLQDRCTPDLLLADLRHPAVAAPALVPAAPAALVAATAPPVAAPALVPAAPAAPQTSPGPLVMRSHTQLHMRHPLGKAVLPESPHPQSVGKAVLPEGPQPESRNLAQIVVLL